MIYSLLDNAPLGTLSKRECNDDLPDPDDIVEPMDKLEEIVDKLESKLSLLPPWWGILL